MKSLIMTDDEGGSDSEEDCDMEFDNKKRGKNRNNSDDEEE